MRKVVTIQLVLGLALLFGSSYGALRAYLAPTLEGEAETRAMFGARLVAAETVNVWSDLVASRRNAVTALAQTPILRSLAADAKETERAGMIKSALEGALRGTGGVGSIGLYDAKGAAVVPGTDATLSKLAATKAALDGGATVRVETIDGVLQLVAAAPAGNNGALVMSLPIEVALLGRLRAGLPQGTQAAVMRAGQPAVSTFPASAKLGNLTADRLDVAGASYRLSHRELVDDTGAALIVVGLAPLQIEGQAPVESHLSLGLLMVSGAALLLVLLVTGLASRGDGEDEHQEESVSVDIANTFDLPRRDAPAPAPVVLAPSTPLKLKFNEPPPAQLIRDAKPIDFPSAPTPEPQPSPYAQKTLPAHPTPAPPPSSSSNLPAWASGPSMSPPTPAPSPPPPPPWSDPASPSLFDAIANAAITAPPAPAPAPVIAPMSFGGEDLPAPKEGFSPEVMAAQRAAAQRAAHSAPTQPPTMAPNFASTPYDADLPMPKGANAVAPFTPRPTGPVFQNPTKPIVPTAPAQSSAIPLAPSRPRSPSIPPTALVAPSLAPRPSSIPGISQSKAIPLPGRSSSSPGRDPLIRNSSVPGDSYSSIPTAAGTDPQPFDEDHYRFVYNEFVSSKAKLGEAVENITYEGFRTKLRSSEQALLDRHGCRAVRFQVLVKDKTVSLRPQLVR